MAKMKIVIEGMDKILNSLGQMPVEVGRSCKPVLNQAAERILAKAIQLCPYDPKRKSGQHLRDSGHIRPAESDYKPTAHIYFGAPHAHLVHEDIAGFHKTKQHSIAGTGPKFLEKPFLEDLAKVESQIETAIQGVINRAS